MDAQVNIESARITYNETNNFSSKIKLVKLSIEKIVTKIKTYRREKKLPKKYFLSAYFPDIHCSVSLLFPKNNQRSIPANVHAHEYDDSVAD